MNEYMPKFYTLKDMTQEDLNELALERNTFANEIERLNNKIKDITEQMNEQINFKTENANEIIRLNNIINELEKWLEDNLGNCRTNIRYTSNQIYNLKEDTYYRCLNKLQELKGDSSNE